MEELEDEINLFDIALRGGARHSLRQETSDLTLRMHSCGEHALAFVVLRDLADIDGQIISKPYGPGDESLRDSTKLFGLRIRGLDTLVQYEIPHEVTEHCPSVRGVAVELSSGFAMTHRLTLLRSSYFGSLIALLGIPALNHAVPVVDLHAERQSHVEEDLFDLLE